MQQIHYIYQLPAENQGSLNHKVDKLLQEGWRVVSVTPQHVARSHGGESNGSDSIRGGWCVVLEKA